MKLPIALAAASLLALTACSASPAEDELSPGASAPAATNQAATEAATSTEASASAQAAGEDWEQPDAPDIFKFKTTDFLTGEEFDGTSILYKDVVLWFWASWCPVCDAEAGAIVAAQPDFPEGVTVIGVGGLSDVESSKQFVEDHPGVENFINIYDETGDIWRDFGATVQPTMVLINQDGQSQVYQGGYGKFDIIEKVAWLGEN